MSDKIRNEFPRDREQIVAEIARETQIVMEGEKSRRKTTLELVLRSLRNLSADGNVRAFRAIHEMLQRYAPEQAVQRGGYLIMPAPMTPEEWEKMVYEQQRKARGEPDLDSDVAAT